MTLPAPVVVTLANGAIVASVSFVITSTSTPTPTPAVPPIASWPATEMSFVVSLADDRDRAAGGRRAVERRSRRVVENVDDDRAGDTGVAAAGACARDEDLVLALRRGDGDAVRTRGEDGTGRDVRVDDAVADEHDGRDADAGAVAEADVAGVELELVRDVARLDLDAEAVHGRIADRRDDAVRAVGVVGDDDEAAGDARARRRDSCLDRELEELVGRDRVDLDVAAAPDVRAVADRRLHVLVDDVDDDPDADARHRPR